MGGGESVKDQRSPQIPYVFWLPTAGAAASRSLTRSPGAHVRALAHIEVPKEKPLQVDLYQTLKSINVTDDQAKLVVSSLEEYIDDMVGDATKPLQ